MSGYWHVAQKLRSGFGGNDMQHNNLKHVS